MARRPEGGRSRSRPDETEQILGRKPDLAEKDVASVVSRRKIAPRWKKQYQRLLQLRDEIIDEESQLDQRARQNQPDPIIDEGAESASSSFTRDLSLGQVSDYQELLDEVNDALARIENGTYGICQLTGRKIPPDRLAAIPWTRFTLEAEEHLEAEGTPAVRFELPPTVGLRADRSSGGTVQQRPRREEESS